MWKTVAFLEYRVMMNKYIISSFFVIGALMGCSPSADEAERAQAPKVEQRMSSVWDLFAADTSEQVTQVNRFIWHAALEVLDFLPIESIDPYSGVIVTGLGTPPGGRQAYRASIRIDDPALDARSLKLSLFNSAGRAIDAQTTRAIEDAILQRARQMRVRKARF